MKNPYFGRLLTAMVTPFNADGSVNYERRLIWLNGLSIMALTAWS